MDKNRLLEQMKESILKGDKAEAAGLAEKALELNLDPREVIEQGYSAGIKEAGDLWEEGEYFLPEVVMASEAMKEAIEILKPEMEKRREEAPKLGTVVMGTIEGDIHDIGKTLVASLLSAAGFTVIDLGVDVPVDKFIETALKNKADIIGMSALLTTTMPGQKKLIEKLKEQGIRDKFKVLVGGAPVSRKWAQDIEADAAPLNAMEAIRTAREMIKG